MKKDSFILYNSFFEALKTLNNEQLGRLFKAIFEYTIDEKITEDNDILVAFLFIKNQLDIDNKKWEDEKNKRSEAGKKGMASRWNNNVKSVITKDNNVINAITKITDNVNVNENVNVNDNVINNNTIVSSSNIIKYIEANFKRPIVPVEYEKINDWEKRFDAELIKYAVDIASLNHVKTFKYVNGILNNWEANDYKTKEDVINNEFKHKEKNNVVNDEVLEYNWLEGSKE